MNKNGPGTDDNVMNHPPVKVLLIEDDQGDIDLFRELLSEVKTPSFTVKTADTLESGLKRLDSEQVDVVLLDLMLPDSQGLDTFTRVRAQAPSAPVVIHTSLSNETLALEAVRQGAQDYLVKGRVDGQGLSRAMRYAIERQRLEEALSAERERLQRLKDIFVGNASHELGAPVTVIREGLRHILQGALGEITEEQKRFLSICLEATERLGRIAEELLNISKLEPGQTVVKGTRLDLVSLAKEAVCAFTPMAKDKGLELATRFSGETILVQADKDKLIEVLTNLVGNAIKYTRKGHVEIAVVEKDGSVECTVSDTGRGIAEEDLPKVFGRFQRFGSKDEKGTGLGLAICKDLVELHGGKIRVESRLNQGTQFTFTLPR
jgi:signal transduction histidine kinase